MLTGGLTEFVYITLQGETISFELNLLKSQFIMNFVYENIFNFSILIIIEKQQKI